MLILPSPDIIAQVRIFGDLTWLRQIPKSESRSRTRHQAFENIAPGIASSTEFVQKCAVRVRCKSKHWCSFLRTHQRVKMKFAYFFYNLHLNIFCHLLQFTSSTSSNGYWEWWWWRLSMTFKLNLVVLPKSVLFLHPPYFLCVLLTKKKKTRKTLFIYKFSFILLPQQHQQQPQQKWLRETFAFGVFVRIYIIQTLDSQKKRKEGNVLLVWWLCF